MKYTTHNKDEYIKLTIRVTKKDYDRFSQLCTIYGTSMNNQINQFIRKYNYTQREVFEDNEIMWHQNKPFLLTNFRNPRGAENFGKKNEFLKNFFRGSLRHEKNFFFGGTFLLTIKFVIDKIILAVLLFIFICKIEKIK